MNRFFFFLLLMVACVVCLYLALPWYSIGLMALLIALPFRIRRRAGFWFPYLAALFVYGGYLTLIQFSNDGILANRVGELFQVGSGWTMVTIAACWGGLTAALGGWTGVCLRKAFGK